MTSPDVVVVGAGFAGLSAAAALAEAGRRVLVLDARPQLGGRATSFTDRATGERVDNGQHVLFGCYRESMAFLRRIGAEGNVRRQPALTVPFLDRSGRRSVLSCPALPPPMHLLAGVLAWSAMPWRDRLAAVRMAMPIRAAQRALARTGTVVLPHEPTVSDWLRAHGQRDMLTSWLWEPLAVAALNQPPDEALAAPFVRVLAEMFGPDVEASALVLPAMPLDRMYAEPARTFIERHGGEVRRGALARLVTDAETIKGVEVRGAPAEFVETSTVISSVPWHALRTLFADRIPESLQGLVSSAAAMASKSIVTVNLWYDRRVMEEPFVGLPGRSMQWVFDKRLAFGAEASHLSLVASGADALAAERSHDLVSRAASEVAESIPGARNARLLRGTVVREKQATFSLAAGEPVRPGTRTSVKGFYLAGDWTDTGLPGTIESAVVSGHKAAQIVVGRL